MKNNKFTLILSCILLIPLKSKESTEYIDFSEMIKINSAPIEKPKKVVLKEETNNIIEAMIIIESRGNSYAYNKVENAVGCLQIRPIMVREVNRILRKNGDTRRFKLKDRWDRDKSIQMFWIWRNHHHPKSTDEVIARNWNGGPNGYKKKSTEKYWEKVSSCLE